MTRRSAAVLLLLALAPWSTTLALDLRVGTGTGCTHATLGAALLSLHAQTGTHTVRINKGTYAVPSGMTYTPSVNQTGVYLEGGYSDCLAAGPSGDPANDADRAVFDGAGGLSAAVLDLQIYGQVGTFQMRRIVIKGGEASGLYVSGQASVLIGLGTTIRNNTSTTDGGGVTLVGSQLGGTGTVARVDFYIDEGAEIRNNIATESGGGIYCGNALGDRHATIVFRDGTLGYNEAHQGAAFYCKGTLEGGGGLQPRPAPGRVAWIVGNQQVGTGPGIGCAAGLGTLDASQAVQGDGFRHLGAAPDSNGLLAVTLNTGAYNPGLCLFGSYPRSNLNDLPPAGMNRFRLRNLYVSNQFGSGNVVGLGTFDRLELIVEPSGDSVSCNFFSATPCVHFTANSADTGDGRLLYATSESLLQLRRAMIDQNTLRSDLASASDGGQITLLSSIVDDNTVANRTEAPNTSALFSAWFNGVVDVSNSTVRMTSPLTQFYRLGWTPTLPDPTGIGYAQASAFASTVGTPLAVGFEGSAPTASFRRHWCGYFVNTSGFAGHTVVNDPVTGTYTLAANFSVDASYSPTHPDLRDACRPPLGTLDRDFYGRPFNVVVEPGSPAHADIGAVEAQLQVDIFSNGFET